MALTKIFGRGNIFEKLPRRDKKISALPFPLGIPYRRGGVTPLGMRSIKDVYGIHRYRIPLPEALVGCRIISAAWMGKWRILTRLEAPE